MLSCPLKFSGSGLPNLSYVIEHTRTYSTSGAYLVKITCPCVDLGLFGFLKGHEHVYPRKIAQSCKGVHSDLFPESDLNDEKQVDSQHQEREKIGHRNKGKVLWNTGRKHSEETLERIRRRTKEALKDPKVKSCDNYFGTVESINQLFASILITIFEKEDQMLSEVRKKMSEAPRALSNQTKYKIRASLTRLWGNRLKWKRPREKFLQLWAESIAEADKAGGSDEQELDWDSYDKLKQEIALLQIPDTAEKAKAKEMAPVRVQRAADVKAEKMARLAQKRREREENNAKAKGRSFRKRNKKSKEEKERLAEFQEEKLKERLMKIHKRKSAVNQVSSQHQRPWEKLDLDIEKGSRQETSLADQIRFAKSRRSEQLLDNL